MSSKIFRSLNPATGEILDELLKTPPDRIDELIERADQAQSDWENTPVSERVDIVSQLADNIESEADDLGRLMVREQGKPIAEARGEVHSTVRRIRHFCERAEADLEPETVHLDETTGVIHHRPYGVVGSIAPWNFPLTIPIWSIVPALLAGNSVVFKPSELTPVLGKRIVELMPERLRDDHVIVLVQGAGRQGEAIVSNQAVRSLAFVGSYRTGTSITEASAPYVRKVGLELGGKDPVIVLPGADLDRAVNLSVAGAFKNCGQVCCGYERALVHSSLVDDYTERMVDRMKDLSIGPGEEDPDLGPMIREEERNRVRTHLDDARNHGATVHTGGPVPESDGFWVEPAVIENASVELTVMNEETFGPVLPIWEYDEIEEAIAEANRLEYGLGASLIGENPDELESVAGRIEAGNIGINQTVGAVVEFPWGGVKRSGNGRLLGPRGILRFTQEVTHRWNREEGSET